MKFIAFLLLALCVTFYSCKLPQKNIMYLQNVSTIDSTAQSVTTPELQIQKGDILSIQIASIAIDPKGASQPQVDAIYNMPNSGGASAGSSGSSSTTSTAGYLVDESGNILHHRLGVFHAAGLTKQQLANEIIKRLTEPVVLLYNPTVTVRLINFRVTMLGQVGQQGTITIPGERVTVLEAVGMAGGVTNYGKKTGIKILREKNGQREIGYIDLSAKSLFSSPYYYLSQNDVIIVEETNRRIQEEEQTRVLQKISFAFTLVTVAATMANIFIKN
jgi:polysaccharide export outer membrane protein